MSDGLEHDVDKTLDSNFKKLEEKFNSEHEIETDFTAVQGMGNYFIIKSFNWVHGFLMILNHVS